MTRPVAIRPVLGFALALALPAYLVTNESFRPFEARFQLAGDRAVQTIDLATREPLFLEYELILRAPVDARPTVVVDLNGSRAATIPARRLFATQHDNVLLAFAPVRQGENRLEAAVEGAPGAAFEVRARVHNYYGIAPDFPRVFVVADESVAHATAARPLFWRGVRFLVFYLASLALLFVVGLAVRRPSGAGAALLLLSPSLVPWLAVIYGIATPLHIWLSGEAAVVSALVGWGLTGLAQWMGRRRRRVIRFAVASVLSLGLLEVALRAFNAVKPSFVFYSDSYDRFRGRAHAPFFDARLNSRGFNDIEHAVARPPNVARRIVAIGDSFALGVVPYRDNYLTLLESELGGPVEVINMGVAATTPADYLSILVKEGMTYQPTLVMAGVFVGNDFEIPRRKPHEYSYVATLAHAASSLWRAGAPVTAPAQGGATGYQDDEPSLSRNRFLEIEVERAWIYDAADDRLAAAAARVAGHLREMREIARRGGADFAVVLIPDEAQVDPELRDEVARASGRVVEQLDFERPNRALAAELSRERVRLLDLLPVFRERGREVRLYKPQDTHWNLAGNRLAAEAIAAFLGADGKGH
jgi:GGDEF domain-containing protein